MKRILIIDDDQHLCELLGRFLSKQGFKVETALSSQEGINKFKENPFDLVISDYRIDNRNGAEVFQDLKVIYPNVKLIMITGYSHVKTAVEIMKEGAFDYIGKPFIPDEILKVVNNAIAADVNSVQPANTHRLEDGTSNGDGRKVVLRAIDNNEILVGNSTVIKEVFKQVKLVAPTNYSVIIYGESGTGKEVMARAIHEGSNRSVHPFVALDCGTLSRELAGSELFGHVKGSFTGAVNDKEGHFEMANKGTLFLDEVANLSIEIQASLLRVLQERKFKRVGGTKEIEVDIRILVASNENLHQGCKEGKFREDLYHRLNEFSIVVPALHNRKEDIPLFAEFFRVKTNNELNKSIPGFDPEVIELLMEYPWPGNLREMRNVIRRLVLFSDKDKPITTKMLPLEFTEARVKLKV